MGLVVWLMMGIAVWHFTVFVPDRFWGGIVGAFLVAAIGAVAFGFVVNGLTVPGQNDTDIVQALIAIPGAVLGPRGLLRLGLPLRRGARPRPRPHARGLGLAAAPPSTGAIFRFVLLRAHSGCPGQDG